MVSGPPTFISTSPATTARPWPVCSSSIPSTSIRSRPATMSRLSSQRPTSVRSSAPARRAPRSAYRRIDSARSSSAWAPSVPVVGSKGQSSSDVSSSVQSSTPSSGAQGEGSSSGGSGSAELAPESGPDPSTSPSDRSSSSSSSSSSKLPPESTGSESWPVVSGASIPPGPGLTSPASFPTTPEPSPAAKPRANVTGAPPHAPCPSGSGSVPGGLPEASSDIDRAPPCGPTVYFRPAPSVDCSRTGRDERSGAIRTRSVRDRRRRFVNGVAVARRGRRPGGVFGSGGRSRAGREAGLRGPANVPAPGVPPAA